MVESCKEAGNAEIPCLFDVSCEKLQSDNVMSNKAETINIRFFMMLKFIVINLKQIIRNGNN